MIAKTESDVTALRKVGAMVAQTLAEMMRHVQPGVTTSELDAIGAATLAQLGARSAPILLYKFPGATCISINQEAAHGIPSPKRILKAGDLVNLDVSAEYDGYFCDAGATVPVAPIEAKYQKLCDCAQHARDHAIERIIAGKPMYVVGIAVESVARGGGFSVLRNLTGHGIGRHLHEQPDSVQNIANQRDKRKFADGMVLAIEPFLTTGALESHTATDGWTELIPKEHRVAQYEHTIIVTDSKPIILTQL